MNRRMLLLIAATVVVLIGTALVYVYVKGADQRADQRFDAVKVVTAIQQIEIGESVDAAAAAGKFQLTDVPQGAVLPSSVASIESLSGLVATTTVFPGEQVVTEKFGSSAAASNLDIPEGQVAISVQLSDTARVAGFVNPGSEVAIFSNVVLEPEEGAEDSIEEPGTVLLLDRVTIIGVGSTVANAPVAPADGDPAATPVEVLPTTLLTLAVTQEEAQKVMYATTNGSITFALLTPDSQISRLPVTTIDNLIG